jgi:phosphoglycolate phosphatase-like HAD superfamily hydrolase
LPPAKINNLGEIEQLMSQLNKTHKVDAILWDFDGTLADSTAKNISITKTILNQVAPRLTGDNLPRSLQSIAEYHIANHGSEHWRQLYRDYFGMTPSEIEIAGPMWETHQMLDQTEVSLFDGVKDMVKRFSGFPQGICSANASQHIRQVLETHGIDSAFRSVIGYEDLPQNEQKPAPDGGLKCLKEIFGDTQEKTIVFIGDHIADVIFARGLKQRLSPSNQVISVVVTYSGAVPERWSTQPDWVFDSPAELLDWVEC